VREPAINGVRPWPIDPYICHGHVHVVAKVKQVRKAIGPDANQKRNIGWVLDPIIPIDPPIPCGAPLGQHLINPDSDGSLLSTLHRVNAHLTRIFRVQDLADDHEVASTSLEGEEWLQEFFDISYSEEQDAIKNPKVDERENRNTSSADLRRSSRKKTKDKRMNKDNDVNDGDDVDDAKEQIKTLKKALDKASKQNTKLNQDITDIKQKLVDTRRSAAEESAEMQKLYSNHEKTLQDQIAKMNSRLESMRKKIESKQKDEDNPRRDARQQNKRSSESGDLLTHHRPHSESPTTSECERERSSQASINTTMLPPTLMAYMIERNKRRRCERELKWCEKKMNNHADEELLLASSLNHMPLHSPFFP